MYIYYRNYTFYVILKLFSFNTMLSLSFMMKKIYLEENNSLNIINEISFIKANENICITPYFLYDNKK